MTLKHMVMALLWLPASLRAQQGYDTTFRSYYYDQKLSLFEKMPTPAQAVVWLGDSITDGGEWSELFPEQKNLNRGISADNTFGVLYRLPEIIRRKPSKIFILIGINDIARNIPDSVILRNYRRIIETIQAQSPATRLFVQSILPTNDQFPQFKNHQHKTEHIRYINNALQNLCAEKKITLVNLYDAFLDAEGKLDNRYTNDGLHLTGEGYLRWKEVLVQGGYMKHKSSMP